MTLIHCTECHRNISDKAPFCPHCGFNHDRKRVSEKESPPSTVNSFAAYNAYNGLGDRISKFRFMGDVSYLQPSEKLPTGGACLKLYEAGMSITCNNIEVLIDSCHIFKIYLEDEKTHSLHTNSWLNRAISDNLVLGPIKNKIPNTVLFILEFKNIRTKAHDTLIFRTESIHRSPLESAMKLLQKSKTDNSILKYMAKYEKFDHIFGCGTLIVIVGLIIWIINNCSGN